MNSTFLATIKQMKPIELMRLKRELEKELSTLHTSDCYDIAHVEDLRQKWKQVFFRLRVLGFRVTGNEVPLIWKK